MLVHNLSFCTCHIAWAYKRVCTPLDGLIKSVPGLPSASTRGRRNTLCQGAILLSFINKRILRKSRLKWNNLMITWTTPHCASGSYVKRSIALR